MATRMFRYIRKEDVASIWWSGWVSEPMLSPHCHYAFLAEWMCDGSCKECNTNRQTNRQETGWWPRFFKLFRKVKIEFTPEM